MHRIVELENILYTDGTFKDHFLKSLGNIPEYCEKYKRMMKNHNIVQRLASTCIVSTRMIILVYYYYYYYFKCNVKSLQSKNKTFQYTSISDQ